ncbi:hypothetical protein Tsubulata_017990 [Turnera subulata]|uniref:Cytochrome P450 n=1 Tax=Turnera subulata TaxID=218843 RepID=A0A9Q0F4L6_9ROSI|nr:hypothetical protein Tsubulata_017990 [Turnera subulata]
MIINYLSICLFLYIIYNLFKFLNKVWWTPIRLQSAMRSQGITGPPYRFLHGNTKEITSMRNGAISKPMEISHQILPRIQPHVYSWTKLYGLNFLNWYGSKAQLVVSEPELVKEVMNNKDGAILKAMIQDYADKLLGNGLFASQGEKWMKMRKLANHTFHADSLKGMIPAMIVSVEIMLERWRQEKVQEVEMHQEFKILTSDVISRVVFGFSHLEGKNIFEMVAKLSLIVARNNFKVGIPGIKKFLRTRDDIESDELEKGIRESIIKIMKKREEEVMLGKRDSYGSDYLGLLLKVHHDNDNSKSISVDDVIDECKSFYVAGYETTSSAITWTIFLLAIHTEWQERAREEVFELFGHQNPTTDGGGRLKTIGMIVNESLRLYPPVFNLTREVQREVRLGKLVIPEKMAVCLPVLALHHDPQIWGEDVHIFKPERFADGVAKATKSCGAAFMPFGMGPRTCVGLNFAFAEIKIALSMILQRYSFTLSPTYVHSPVHILTICPQYGLQIILQPL